MTDLETRYQAIRERIRKAALRSGREDSSVTLMAVSKTQSADAVEALWKLGHRDFGENYAQELLEKARELSRRGCEGIRWHFIGHLQTNKVKALLPAVQAIHSVDSLKLAQEIDKRWRALGKAHPLEVFLEVNLDGEESKSGLASGAVAPLVQEMRALPGLRLAGLMAIPAPRGPDQDEAEPFRRLRELESGLHPLSKGGLSMGMSGDFETAIAEGATHVRVGTALFGERRR